MSYNKFKIMETIEELKEQVKKSIISEIGEEKYYKLIAESLEKLVPIKESIDLMFIEDKEQKSAIFKQSVLNNLVFERYTNETEQNFFIGYYELVFDVFEF